MKAQICRDFCSLLAHGDDRDIKTKVLFPPYMSDPFASNFMATKH